MSTLVQVHLRVRILLSKRSPYMLIMGLCNISLNDVALLITPQTTNQVLMFILSPFCLQCRPQRPDILLGKCDRKCLDLSHTSPASSWAVSLWRRPLAYVSICFTRRPPSSGLQPSPVSFSLWGFGILFQITSINMEP